MVEFDSDSEHQAVLMFRRLDMARAEGDGKGREHDGHEKAPIAGRMKPAAGA